MGILGLDKLEKRVTELTRHRPIFFFHTKMRKKDSKESKRQVAKIMNEVNKDIVNGECDVAMFKLLSFQEYERNASNQINYTSLPPVQNVPEPEHPVNSKQKRLNSKTSRYKNVYSKKYEDQNPLDCVLRETEKGNLFIAFTEFHLLVETTELAMKKT